MARQQLLELGHSAKWIEHRIVAGRLHRIHNGVYAVGRPAITQPGRWMAAVLACGPGAVLSHDSAAGLWLIRAATSDQIHVSLHAGFSRRPRPGIVLHRRPTLSERDVTRRDGIPVTTPICTLIDLATMLDREPLEAAINKADKLHLADPEELRSALSVHARRPGVRRLRELLDRRTFTLTDSELERAFLPLARKAGLPKPLTGVWVNGFKVDFFWPDPGLVVETDGLRYHRTPAQQAKDRLRDQAHVRAGLTPVRFTHAQVRFDPDHVIATLEDVARRLRA